MCLIDGHVHIAHGFPGDPGWVQIADLPSLHGGWGLAGAQAALVHGVTVVRDCGSSDGVALELRRLLGTGVVRGCRVLACGPCLTITGGHGEFVGVVADTVDQLRTTIRALAHRYPDVIKVMATGGSMDPHTVRRRAHYTTEELAVVVAEAERLGVKVVAHANATEGIRNAVEAGVQTIAHCNFLALEEGRLDPDADLARRMAAQGTYIDLNLGAAMAPLRDNDAAADADPPRDRWHLLRELELSDRVFFTSDLFGPRVAEFPSLLAKAARQWQMPVQEVVRRATSLAAEALDLTEHGILRPGAVADIVVLEGDLIADVDVLGRAAAVFQSGELVAQSGSLVVPRG